ncbi:isopeptide-forming domain-containing fimbrial protein [Streptococcus moroccensis]|uniref:Fimbrial isopeptide formation D2 family protein/LPXTG-motif cell wall-anchored protein n=1 Tax=Streptococcus moroccensis TaxID=1451356 RepID=A0ABT9YTW9_9STRE|nr:isopeptide-forming domain-containing fimbrial protein [Streptococcus moroccensis]MDQ0223433.1 fimbrial isopeptide formation D2 family protein/LPXTG-motif cell wall-anchored protein [Streptococcus moroccensis]
MKKINKIFAVLAVLILTLASVIPATKVLAAGNKTNTITVHKIVAGSETDLKTISEELNKTYDGNKIEELQSKIGTAKDVGGIVFKLQKLINPTLAATLETVHPDAVSDDSLWEDITDKKATTVENQGAEINTSDLEPGKYRLVEVYEESTYTDGKNTVTSSLAVPTIISLPIENKDGVVENAHLYPKNNQDKPQIDKNFANGTGNSQGADYAKYQAEKGRISKTIGQTVPYEVKTQVPKDAKYAKLVWTDTMMNGLTMGDTVELVATRGTFVKGTDYTVDRDDRGFTLKFTKEGLAKLQAVAKEGAIDFTLTYSATVNGSAVVDQPQKNDIRLDYGNNPGKDNEEKPVTPENGEINVNKTWAAGSDSSKAKVVYTLKNSSGEAVASVYLDNTITSGTTFDLGNGISFVVTDLFSGKFTGLSTEQYKISERVSGYSNGIDVAGNTATITNTPDTDNPTPLDPTEPEVVTYGKKFVKADATSNVRLAGAEFVFKTSSGKYLKLNSDNQDAKTKFEAADKAYKDAVALVKVNSDGTIDYGTTSKEKIEDLKVTRDAAYKASQMKYTEVNTPEEATVFTSDDQGRFEITGLSEGEYQAVERKAPDGYALPSNPEFVFTVGKGTYQSGEMDYTPGTSQDDAQLIKNQKTTIPQTGGIGTIIFAVTGASLMAIALIAYMKNKNEDEEVA